jgi:hypothetical protein
MSRYTDGKFVDYTCVIAPAKPGPVYWSWAGHYSPITLPFDLDSPTYTVTDINASLG